jgi:hypothetical protein
MRRKVTSIEVSPIYYCRLPIWRQGARRAH